MIVKNENSIAAIYKGRSPFEEVWVGEHYVWPEGIKGWLIDDFHRSYDIVYDGNPTLTPSDVTSTMPLNDIKNAFIAGKTQSIGNFAFMRAVNMTSLSIEGSDVTYIGRGAFMSATSLSSVSMTDNVLSIDGNAFDSCINLSGITLSENLQIIGEEAFQYSGLREITIPDTVGTIGQGAFRNCVSLSAITLGSGVTAIPQEMLRGCTSLVSITIPSGVTSIGASALRYNTGMTGITMVSSTPPTLGANAFDSTANCPIFVPCGSLSAYQSANVWSTYASRLEEYGCPKAIITTSIGNTVYVPDDGSGVLTQAEIWDAVGGASGRSGVTQAEVLDCVTEIGDGAFNNCTGLTSITIADSVTTIGTSGLSNIGLSSITLPSGVITVGDYALYWCRSLTSVTFPDSVQTIGKCCCQSGNALAEAAIGSGVTSIGQYAFTNNPITSLTIDADVPPAIDGNGSIIPYNASPWPGHYDCDIFVPCTSVDTYKNHQDWSRYSAVIQCITST